MSRRKARKPGAQAGAGGNIPRPAAEAGEAADRGRTRWLWAAAILLVISGYALLHKVDPGGRNAWAVISPALLLTGYLLVIPAIILSYRR